MDEIIELERRFWEAAGDPAYYEERFADEGVMVFSVGVMDKQAVVASMEGAAEWPRFTIDDPKIIEITPEVVSLTYTTEAYQAGSDEPYRAGVTSVYARRGGGWRLVLHQQTPLA